MRLLREIAVLEAKPPVSRWQSHIMLAFPGKAWKRTARENLENIECKQRP
ncbi:MAG: hypothetical protein MUE44_28205 [Oscillatoriaceae cyanobacterium Prado104]|nr:hypothetical protein [Oscillatoriaceae cyanobacterium Prado104]